MLPDQERSSDRAGSWALLPNVNEWHVFDPEAKFFYNEGVL